MDKSRPKIGHPEREQTQPRDLFFDELRKALRHLYDPEILRKNGLMQILPIDEKEGQVSLQRILIAGIEALKPNSSLSPQSSSWRIYHILSSRYVQQFHQNEVASSLGLSLRQIRRQDNLAVKALAEHLISHHNIPPEKVIPDGSGFSVLEEVRASGQAEDAPSPSQAPSQEEELAWLGKSQVSEVIGVNDLLLPLFKMVEPLAAELNVSLRLDLSANLPNLIVSITPARQAVLMLLTALIRQSSMGSLVIEGSESGAQVVLRMRPLPRQPRPAETSAEDDEFALRLVSMTGGSLAITRSPEGAFIIESTLSLPAARRLPVLVVDDNEDTLNLYQRYLTDTSYIFTSTSHPEQVLALAEKLLPKIILLDVMLPGLDGWELLSRLREHPITRHIPVIVSTILPQEQLAHALGAAIFIRKPVSRPALLQALDFLSGLKR